jgi:hypothetical protein
MKILFERSGGFGGLKVTVKIDMRLIPKLEGRLLDRLVKEADFFNLPSKSKPSAGSDRFRYKLEIRNGKTHSVTRHEDTIEKNLKPLVKFLEAKLRKK